MLNIAALRQQQIPLAAEPRSPVPFHILMKPIGPMPAISPAAIAITRRTKRRSTRWMTRGWSSLSAAILPPSPPARGKSTLSGRGASRCWPA